MIDWNNENIEGYMEGYWKSDSLRFASGGTITRGWQIVLERYQNRYGSRELMGKLTFSNIDVDILGADTALVFGKWELEASCGSPLGALHINYETPGRWMACCTRPYLCRRVKDHGSCSGCWEERPLLSSHHCHCHCN